MSHYPAVRKVKYSNNQSGSALVIAVAFPSVHFSDETGDNIADEPDNEEVEHNDDHGPQINEKIGSGTDESDRYERNEP